MSRLHSVLFMPLLLGACASMRASDENALDTARAHISAGQYTDAVEVLKKELLTTPSSASAKDAALLLVENLRITGKLNEAHAACNTLMKADPKDAAARSLKAELNCETGNYQQARTIFDTLIEEQPENHRAWALRAIVLRILGDRVALKATADHFFELYQKHLDYFNSDEVKDPLELAYLGLGVQDENPKDAFETGFNMAEDLAQKRQLDRPEIYLWSARLALAKYSFVNAEDRFVSLLKIRPKLPDALAGQAAIRLQTMHDLEKAEALLKDALEINPNHVESHLIYAEMNLEEERFDEAKKHLDAALAVNPNHLHALALLAFYFIDLSKPLESHQAEDRALAINPKCADFFCDIGEMMDDTRSFQNAFEYYQKAVALDPDYWRGYYGLGMNLSRQGAASEERGKEMLLKAFAKNRYNVWALNMIKALDRIIGDKEQRVEPLYAEAHTPHFTLKFFGKEAAIVRPYLEEWAEAAYERQKKLFSFEPEGPLSIELCYSFQDQAARTVGLPNLGALGVCFGKLCTVVSPREGRGEAGAENDHPPFNWRKVLEHEFGHVMVLQMSRFRVPRWYTEAFSTYLENDSAIQSDPMMVDAIARDRLKKIEDMNQYFRVNPLMAYVHGRYVIEYIDKTFGFDAHIKAIKLFAQGKNISKVLQEATGKDLATLNVEQLAFLKKAFEKVRRRLIYDPETIAQMEQAARGDDAPAQAIAELAMALLYQRHPNQAEIQARRALEKDPRCVDAMNVLGLVAFGKDDFLTAKKHFEASTQLDPERSFAAWHRLGVIYKKEGQTAKAIEAFEAARKSYPRYTGPDNPYHELPELYAALEPPQLEKALNVWRECLKTNSEDLEAAFAGLNLAVKLKDPKAAVEFALAHIEVDPYNLEVHKLAGKAYEDLGEFTLAIREYSVATAIEETDAASWVGLARAQMALNQRRAALDSANKALEIDGTNAEAKALRAKLMNEN